MPNVNEVKKLEFSEWGDDRGRLVAVEGLRDIPFDIKRCFFIYGADANAGRGHHANRKSKFVLVNVAGNSKVRIKDGKGNEVVICLDRPNRGVYIPEMLWKDMYDFSQDAVLLVLASEHYDAGEYIRDFSDYVSEAQKLASKATE